MRLTRSAALAVALVAALGACGRGAPSTAPSPARARAIFRTIDISPFGSVTLGAPIDREALAVATPAGAGRFALVSQFGFSGSTDSIQVQVDTAQHVVAMYFVYYAGKDFAAAVADYDTTIGRPTRRVARDSAGGRLERITWQDAHTRFELTRFVPRGGIPRIASAMFDRAWRR